MTEAVSTLACVTEFIVDCLHKTAPTQDTGFPLIRTPNIGRGRFKLDGVYRVSQETYDKWSIRAVPQKNDLILAREAPAGNVAIIKSEKPYCLGQRTVLIRPNPELIDAEFLTYFLLAPKQQAALLKNQIGVHVGHVNMKDIRKLPLEHLPSINEQKRRASILASYDDLIENNKRRIELLEESARQLYKEWFVRFRFPGHEHVKIIDGVPEGWSFRPLKEIASITMGQSPKSEFYNSDGDGLPFHQGVTKFGFRFVEHEMYCTKPTRLSQPGDILFSVRAPVGRMNIAHDVIVLGRGLSAIHSIDGRQSFLFYALKSYFFKEDMIGGGAIYASVTKRDMETQELLIPPPSLLNEFNDFSSDVDKQIYNLHQMNVNLTRARSLLLPKLMNGEIVV